MRKPKTWETVRGLPLSVACLVLLTAFTAYSQEQKVNRLSTLKVQQEANATTLVVTGSAPPTFTVFKLTNPTRLFVDISNADISKIEGPIEVENGVISQVTPLQFTDELVRIGRLVIGLESDALYNVRADGNQLLITVNGTPTDSALAVDTPASRARLAAAQARAEEAERRAKIAENRLAEAESKARDADVRAQKEIAAAKAEATAAEERAKATSERANRLADEAAAARKAAETTESDLRKSADDRASELLARAQAAEAAADAARTEAEVARENAAAQEAANQAKIAAAEAKAQAAEATVRATQEQTAAESKAAAAESQQASAEAQRAQERAAQIQAQADAALERANGLEKSAQEAVAKANKVQSTLEKAQTRLAELEAKLNRAEAKARSAETEKMSAEARAADAERQADDARARTAAAEADAADARRTAETAQAKISEAESKLASAEERARTAQSEAQTAAAQVAQAEARARRAEVNALKAAETARKDASSANERALAAEAEAKRLSEVARVARANAANAVNAEASSQAAAEQKADAALARAEAARADAEAARLAATSSIQAADAQREAAEARAREAMARAMAAESKLEANEAERALKNKEIERLASAAEAADVRAKTAQANLTRLNTELQLAQGRIDQAEQKAAASRAALVVAEGERSRANTNAARATADAALAQQRIETARSEANAASERAYAAEQRAIVAEKNAQMASSEADALRKKADTQSSNEAAESAEARARMAAVEAKAQRLEAERALLAQRLGQLETERMTSKAQMTEMATELARLDQAVTSARAQQDQKNAELLAAQRRAKDAELKAEQANNARIESAQANSIALKQMKVLEAKIADAQNAQQDAEVKRLSIELANAQRSEAELRLSLKENQRALQRATQDAATSQAELVSIRTEQERAATQATLEVAQTPETPAPVAPIAAKSETAPVEAAPATVLPPPPPRLRSRVTEVKFDENATDSRVAITVEGNADYVVRRDGDRTRILELRRALIDPSQERNLDTSEFPGAVKLVSSFQAEPPGDRVNIVVTLSDDVNDQVVLNGNLLEWRFDRPVRTRPTVANLPPPPAWAPNTEVQFDQSKAAVFTGLGQSIVTRKDDDAPRPARRKRYMGHRINIDIKDGEIHNVLRLLAKEGGVNIVTSDDVAGTVTMHLRQVPWDQALEIILRTKGLAMVDEGQIIRVAPAESIAKEREAELKNQEVQEKLKPLEVKLITVNHATAADLIPRLESVLSARGKAQFDERTNTVIVRDVDEYLDAAVDMINRLDTQTPQVLIETRIVEVNEVNIQQLGIQWGIDSSWSAATGNPTGLRFPSSVGISGGADDQQSGTEGVSSNPNFVVNLPASAGLGSGGALGMTFGSIDSTFNLNVRLSALENRGSVKIVSSPKITTLDNKKARISQGVSIPISQVSASGIQTIFFDAVLSLEVIPHVTQDGNIYLNLNAQNNTPDFQNVGARGDPTILKKEAQTELLLKDGDTTVIGGIYTSNNGFNHSEVPFFAQIPILGAMFRNHQESERRTELLIFVTPRIVNRAASKVRTLP